MALLRYLAVIAVVVAIFWGCSRKGDESLPPRTGSLQVHFTIHEESNHLPDPSSIPVIVSLYSDTLHARLIQSKDVTAKDDTPAQVTFNDLVVNFYWLEIMVNEADLPAQCQDTRVYIQQDLTTTTSNLEYTLRQDFWVCPSLGP